MNSSQIVTNAVNSISEIFRDLVTPDTADEFLALNAFFYEKTKSVLEDIEKVYPLKVQAAKNAAAAENMKTIERNFETIAETSGQKVADELRSMIKR